MKLGNFNVNQIYPLQRIPRTWFIEGRNSSQEPCYFVSLMSEPKLGQVRKDPVHNLPLSFFSWVPKHLFDAANIEPHHFNEWNPFIEYFHGEFLPKCLGKAGLVKEWAHRAKLLPAYTWMNISDSRSISEKTRLPEDIFGVVQLDSQHNFIPNTYQRLFTHRLISLYGKFKLPKDLQEALERDLLNEPIE